MIMKKMLKKNFQVGISSMNIINIECKYTKIILHSQSLGIFISFQKSIH